MPLLIVKTSFDFAHDGVRVETIQAHPEPQDLTDRCAEVALEQGWASEPGSIAPQPPAKPKAEAKAKAAPAADPQQQADLEG